MIQIFFKNNNVPNPLKAKTEKIANTDKKFI